MSHSKVRRLLIRPFLAFFLLTPVQLLLFPVWASSTEGQVETGTSSTEIHHEDQVRDSRISAANEGPSSPLPLMDETGQQTIGEKVCAAEPPLLMAEGSNGCEIVSCGMGIKQTCKITCPAGQTPKCSCDCERSFGPICTDYKANCRCE
ncbi:MAG: hypothetical protein AB7G48_09910 [Nitrospiraceae bacterium]